MTVREGLRSARKSPHFVIFSRRLSQPAPTQAALLFENLATRDDDIQYFSDKDERPFGRSQRQSYQTSTARTLPVHSHNPYHHRTGHSAATAAAGTGMLPNRWQERPERQRRLRDAASSNTSFAQALVRRPERAAAAAAATAHRWASTNSSTAAAATSVAGTSDNWFYQWTAAKASGGGGEETVRNDLVGGSGVISAGSYRMMDHAAAGTGSYDETLSLNIELNLRLGATPVVEADIARNGRKGKRVRENGRWLG
jgi:hypothetical protein